MAQDDAASQSNSMTSTAGCPSVMPDTQIEVTADLSEFRQTEKVVLLQGSVDVIQGPLRVRAETIKLQYEPNDKSSDKAYAGTVTSLQADGNVRIDCNGEHAEGEQAYYDILQRTIKLTGDVLLVREGNILRGDRLDIDLNSGRSAIVGDATVSKKPGKGRVHAIFKPTEKDG
jgi:lipopolysaccharide export system protein LptA